MIVDFASALIRQTAKGNPKNRAYCAFAAQMVNNLCIVVRQHALRN